jgi:hypothetical protein
VNKPCIARLGPVLAVIDQAWLSLLSLATSLAFICFEPKTEFAAYALLLAPIALAQGLQNAALNSPFASVFPAASEANKPSIQRTVGALQILCIGGLSLLSAIGLLIYQGINAALDPLLVVGFGIVVAGVLAREAARCTAYVKGAPGEALLGDAIYGALLLLGVGGLLLCRIFSPASLCLLMGLAGLAATGFRSAHSPKKIDREVAAQVWSCARWALPSVVATWLSLGAYPFFAGKFLGLDAVANLSASRLLVMPAALVMAAWGNFYRPRISLALSLRDVLAVRQVISLSAFVAVVVTLAAMLLINWLFPLFNNFVPAGYRGLRSLVIAWILYSGISFLRNIFMAPLMCKADGFRTLHHITWVGLGLSLFGLFLLSRFGLNWVIGVLCGVELLQLALIAPMVRAELSSTRSSQAQVA